MRPLPRRADERVQQLSRGRLLIVGGGQSGLSAARVGREQGWEPVVLEAGASPVGSWPAYYDGLTLFSPAQYSGFPGFPFPGDSTRYPRRDEVVEFLKDYASWLDVDIRTSSRVATVSADTDGFTVTLTEGSTIAGDALVAASGSFSNPSIPTLPGSELFEGSMLHVSEYRVPEAFAGQRVIVVGAGNSAVQVGHELTQHARVTVATRDKFRFLPQVIAGRDLHFWLLGLRFDLLPKALLKRVLRGTPVIDRGTYRAALDSNELSHRAMFTAFTPDGVIWADGSREQVDTVIFATGYRPHLPYLQQMGALDDIGRPRERHGISTTHPRLAYLGLELQRSFSSNTIRGVHRDAGYVVSALGRGTHRPSGLVIQEAMRLSVLRSSS